MVTLPDTLVARIRDYFTPGELVEYLGVSMTEVLDGFEAEILDIIDELEELLEIANDGEEG